MYQDDGMKSHEKFPLEQVVVEVDFRKEKKRSLVLLAMTGRRADPKVNQRRVSLWISRCRELMNGKPRMKLIMCLIWD